MCVLSLTGRCSDKVGHTCCILSTLSCAVSTLPLVASSLSAQVRFGKNTLYSVSPSLCVLSAMVVSGEVHTAADFFFGSRLRWVCTTTGANGSSDVHELTEYIHQCQLCSRYKGSRRRSIRPTNWQDRLSNSGTQCLRLYLLHAEVLRTSEIALVIQEPSRQCLNFSRWCGKHHHPRAEPDIVSRISTHHARPLDPVIAWIGFTAGFI
jgi:hypothetical protein